MDHLSSSETCANDAIMSIPHPARSYLHCTVVGGLARNINLMEMVKRTWQTTEVGITLAFIPVYHKLCIWFSLHVNTANIVVYVEKKESRICVLSTRQASERVRQTRELRPEGTKVNYPMVYKRTLRF